MVSRVVPAQVRWEISREEIKPKLGSLRLSLFSFPGKTVFSLSEALGRMDNSCVCRRNMKNKKTRNSLRHRTNNASLQKDLCLVGDLPVDPSVSSKV